MRYFVIKVSIVLVSSPLGWKFINPTNYVPFLFLQMPQVLTAPMVRSIPTHPIQSRLDGCNARCRYRFLCVYWLWCCFNCCARDQKSKRDMPIGILGSLLLHNTLCIISHVLTGCSSYTDFIKEARSFGGLCYHPIYAGYGWLATLVSAATLLVFQQWS